jgi:hypothetical protein
MSAPSHWTFGESTLRRIVEYEGPILSPFEIFGDCTQAHLDQNRAWLVPRFQDATSGILIITIQSFLIRRNGLTVLVDACGGNDEERARPHLTVAAGRGSKLCDPRVSRLRTSTWSCARTCMSIMWAGTRG